MLSRVFENMLRNLDETKNKIILVTIGLILCLASCSSKETNPFIVPVSFQEELSQFYDSMLQDKMVVMIGETDNFSLVYTKNGFGDDEIENLKKQLVHDLNQIYKKTKQLPKEPIVIYAFPNEKSIGLYSNENKVFCSMADIENNSYLYQLVQSYFDINNPCISLGLTGYLNDKEYDAKLLKKYFSNEENLELLHLFGPRFYKEWNGQEEYEMAEMTAISLTEFILKEYGFKQLTSVGEEVKNAWVAQIGSPLTYQENGTNYDNYQYTQREGELGITTEDAYYSINLTKYFNTSKQVEDLILTQIKWKKELKEYLKIHAPEYYSTNNLDMKISYRLEKRKSSEQHNTGKNGQIRILNTDDTVFHELGHIYFPPDVNQFMLSDGIAEYVSLILCPYDQRRKIYSAILFEDKAHDILLPYSETVKLYYDKYSDEYTEDKINMEYLIDALALATIKGEYYSKLSSFSQSISEVYKMGKSKTRVEDEGYELTYIQSCSFASFLINQYSLDKVLIFGTSSKSYQEVFKTDYEILKAEWLNYLER